MILVTLLLEIFVDRAQHTFPDINHLKTVAIIFYNH